MKLVEILADIMEEWPDTTSYYAQDRNGVVYPWVTKPHLSGGAWEPETLGGGNIDHNPEAFSYTPDLASDWHEALVTKEMWLAEKGKKSIADMSVDEILAKTSPEAVKFSRSINRDAMAKRPAVGGTSGHIHAESMKLYAEDAAETEKPWERWQGCLKGSECWIPLEQSPAWHTDCEYRRIPTTITIGGEEVPEPVREPLELGEAYWVASMFCGDLPYSTQWHCDDSDMKRLRLGLVHRTKEDAVVHAKALIKVSGGEV